MIHWLVSYLEKRGSYHEFCRRPSLFSVTLNNEYASEKMQMFFLISCL